MNLANRITILRIVIIPFVVASLLYYSPERSGLKILAIVLFVVACVSDGFDGYLARKRNETTEFGAFIDPIADKLLLLSGFLSLSLMGNLPASMHMPAWVTIPVISRDIVILIGVILIMVTRGTLRPQPNYTGKVTTVVQMIALFGSLIEAPETYRFLLNVATVILTVLSGVLYVGMGSRMLQEN